MQVLERWVHAAIMFCSSLFHFVLFVYISNHFAILSLFSWKCQARLAKAVVAQTLMWIMLEALLSAQTVVLFLKKIASFQKYNLKKMPMEVPLLLDSLCRMKTKGEQVSSTAIVEEMGNSPER
jgi:hypothetical protein